MFKKVEKYKEEIINRFVNKNETIKQIGKDLKIHNETLRKLLRSNNIETNRRKRFIDENYFKEINTRDKAYFLGLSYADGCMNKYKNWNAYTFSISLQKDDKAILDKFKEFTKWDGQLYLNNYEQREKEGKIKGFTNAKNQYVFSTSNKVFCQNLLDKGLIPKKSLVLTFPNENILPKYLQKDFLRGYFCGDGCVAKHSGKNPNNLTVIIAGTKDFLTSVQEILSENDIKSSIYKRETQNIYVLQFSSKDSINKFKNFIYTDTDLYIKRKYDKFKPIPYQKENIISYNPNSLRQYYKQVA